MSRRTLADWQTINDEYEASRLSVTEFCRDHDFSPKYFYAVRSKLKQKQQPKSFVKIEREQLPVKHDVITLTFAGGYLSVPSSVSPRWVAELIRALA